MKNLLLITVYISLFFQFIIGITTFAGAFFKVNEKDIILKDILNIETFVQFIELIFYLYLSFSFHKINKNTIASRRYFDWVITTPVMLISTILFMIYNNNPGKTLTTFGVLKKERKIITRIVIYNFLMLVFGIFRRNRINS